MKKFFSKGIILTKYINKLKYKKNKTLYSLQVLRQPINLDKYYSGKKRAFSSSLLNKRKDCFNASLTLEAALTIPVFLITIFTLASFLSVSATEQNLEMSMENTGRAVAKNTYYLREIRDLDDITGLTRKVQSILNTDLLDMSDSQIKYMKQKGFEAYLYSAILKDITSEYLDNSAIAGKSLGLDFSGSSYDEDSGNIILVAKYKYKIPFIDDRIFSMKGSKRLYTKSWTGRSISKEKEEVYITKRGKVYHTMMNCKHLNVKIEPVNYSEIKNVRNVDGKKYSECKECKSTNSTGDIVYITPTGAKYHKVSDCQGINRSIIKVDKSTMTDIRPCKDCED